MQDASADFFHAVAKQMQPQGMKKGQETLSDKSNMSFLSAGLSAALLFLRLGSREGRRPNHLYKDHGQRWAGMHSVNADCAGYVVTDMTKTLGPT